MALHTPKTHAATVQRPNFEEPHYCPCDLIPGDSGHKQASAAVSLQAKSLWRLRSRRKQGQSRECPVHNYGADCLKGGKLAISSGFGKELFPMNLKRPPMTIQKV